jgi:hypothetical protein
VRAVLSETTASSISGGGSDVYFTDTAVAIGNIVRVSLKELSETDVHHVTTTMATLGGAAWQTVNHVGAPTAGKTFTFVIPHCPGALYQALRAARADVDERFSASLTVKTFDGTTETSVSLTGLIFQSLTADVVRNGGTLRDVRNVVAVFEGVG